MAVASEMKFKKTVLSDPGFASLSLAGIFLTVLAIYLYLYHRRKNAYGGCGKYCDDGVAPAECEEGMKSHRAYRDDDAEEMEDYSDLSVATVNEKKASSGGVVVGGADGRQFFVRNRGGSSSEQSLDDAAEQAKRQRQRFGAVRAFSLQESARDGSSVAETAGEEFETSAVSQKDEFSDICSAVSDSAGGIVGKCGVMEVAFAYDAPGKKMTIHALRVRDVPVKGSGSRNSYTQIQVVLLPGKKQKQKSKIRHGENPHYMETFTFNRVTPEVVNNMSVRFRMYGCERMRRQRLIGECIVSFSHVNLQLQTSMWLPLEPRANTAINASACEVLSLCQSDGTGSMLSMQHGGVPELLLGLAYNATSGRLSAEVIKGSNLRRLTSNREPDTFVKLLLVSSTGQEISRSKTTLRKAQPNPLFKETFAFQVALFQLSDVTLMIMVYCKKNLTKKERVGWFTVGRFSSSQEELSHWQEMKQLRGSQLARWHLLIQT